MLLPRQASSAPPPEMSSSSGSGSGRSATEARALKIHSEAERRRRERINAHLAALRRMVPDAKQMDKATLLARVVDQVKDLKRRASETTATQPTPAQTDEVSVECCTGNDDDSSLYYMKASVSCDDRPGLVAGLIGALHGLRLRPVRAEVTSLGGRVQHVFTLCNEEGSADFAGLRSLKEAVRQALARVASPELLCGSNGSNGNANPFQSKRQRILESHYSVMSI